jgi:hypothetical protein
MLHDTTAPVLCDGDRLILRVFLRPNQICSERVQ